MKGNLMEKFAPELRIFDNGKKLVVVFDSLSDVDVKRATSITQIPAVFHRISFELEGFDEASVLDEAAYRTVGGKINLVVTDEGWSVTKYEIADCQLALPAVSQSKGGQVDLEPVEHVEYAVRQGVSDAFLAAITELFDSRMACGNAIVTGQPAPNVESIGNGRVVAVHHRAAGSASASDEPKHFRRNMILAIIGAPVLIWLLVWMMSSPSSHSRMDDAALRSRIDDPNSVAAQVELTRQTLMQMGLDPGQNTDIGCLAP